MLPLHAMWFYGCIRGFYRRASQRQTPISNTGTDEVGILPVNGEVGPPPESNRHCGNEAVKNTQL